MITPTPPEVKPQVANLADLLKWVQLGRLRIPLFQRPFRWDRGRVRDLFDSIRRQYPIGTMLIWIPGSPRPSREILGPLVLPASAGGDMLLIDGQQRVSTIAGVLLQGKLHAAEDIEDPDMWDLWFDAKDLTFRHISSEPAPISCIRVRDLLEIRAIMRASTALQKALRDDDQAQLILEAWQAAATSLTSYRFPVVEFHTNDLSLAVESFTRLNRRGLAISADEMFSALAGDEGTRKRLSDHINDALRFIEDADFGALDRLTVLRLILLELDLDPFRTDWNLLDEDVRGSAKARLETVAVRAQNSLLQALKFMRDELDLVSTRLLPYSGILVGLAAYLNADDKAPSPTERKRLADWCWHAAFAGFAEGNPSRATQIWRALREAGRTRDDSEPLPRISADAAPTPFPSRFDLRAARLQTSLWAAMTTWNMDRAKKILVARFINTAGAHAYRRICRAKQGDINKEFKELLSSPANRAFDEWNLSTNSPSRALAGDQLRELNPDNPQQASRLKRLHITRQAWDALMQGNEESFLKLRLEQMIDDERERMISFGLQPPSERTPQRPAIDHPETQEGLYDEES